MLKSITDELMLKKVEPFELHIEKSLKEKIDLYWNNYITEHPEYYDSEILTVSKFDFDNNIVEIKKMRFSDLFYSAKKGELKTRNLFSAILFKTLDDFYIVIRNSYDSRLNIIGGMAEVKDLEGEYLDYQKCLIREVKEEIGLNLENKEEVLEYKLKYIKVPENEEEDVFYPCGICYTGTLNFTAEEFKKYIDSNYKKFDGEVKEILYVKKDECLNLEFTMKDRLYIKEFFEKELK